MSWIRLCIYFLAFSTTVSKAQKTPLALPVPELCSNRKYYPFYHNLSQTLIYSKSFLKGIQHSHFRDLRNISHAYFFSWEHHTTRDQTVTYDQARNICRRHCMDTVSLETSGENDYLKEKMKAARVHFIWTSGRKCNYGKKCDRPEFQPLIENGWFWAGSGVRIGRTGNRNNGDWSNTGISGQPQPDNHAGRVNGIDEGCLGLASYKSQEIGWHDVRCDYRRAFVCEDSDVLLQFVKTRNPGIQLK